MKTTASLTSLNVHGMDQTGNLSLCPSLSWFSKRGTLHKVDHSESKVLCMVILHINFHLCMLVLRLIKGAWLLVLLCLQHPWTWCIHTFLILAHALWGKKKQLQIQSIFAKTVGGLQELKRLHVKHTTSPVYWESLCDPAFTKPSSRPQHHVKPFHKTFWHKWGETGRVKFGNALLLAGGGGTLGSGNIAL